MLPGICPLSKTKALHSLSSFGISAFTIKYFIIKMIILKYFISRFIFILILIFCQPFGLYWKLEIWGQVSKNLQRIIKILNGFRVIFSTMLHFIVGFYSYFITILLYFIMSSLSSFVSTSWSVSSIIFSVSLIKLS